MVQATEDRQRADYAAQLREQIAQRETCKAAAKLAAVGAKLVSRTCRVLTVQATETQRQGRPYLTKTRCRRDKSSYENIMRPRDMVRKRSLRELAGARRSNQESLIRSPLAHRLSLQCPGTEKPRPACSALPSRLQPVPTTTKQGFASSCASSALTAP